MANRKYEVLMDEANTILFKGRELHRIRALRDIETRHGIVGAGELGGYVESEFNLEQKGECWILQDAKVMDHALVYSNAVVDNDAIVMENARIVGNACVYGNARIMGHAQIIRNASVCGESFVGDNAVISGESFVMGNSSVFGDAYVCGNAVIGESASVSGHALIGGNTVVYGRSMVKGTVTLPENARLDGLAYVASNRHLFTISKVDRWSQTLTFYHLYNGSIGVHAEYQTFWNLDAFRDFCDLKGEGFEEQGNAFADIAEKVICRLNKVAENNDNDDDGQIQEA